MIPRWRKCIHEAGHAVVCERLGGLVLSVTLAPPYTQFFLLGCTPSAQAHGHVLVALAGVLAEKAILGSASLATAEGDIERVQRRLSSCCHRAGDPGHPRRLANFSAALVRRHRFQIEQVANRLLHG